MSENNHYPKFEFMTSPAAENKVHTIYIEKAKHVVPIIFIPGVMGSNLRVKPKDVNDKNTDPVWRLDGSMSAIGWSLPYYGTAKARKLELDPELTEVDDGGYVVDAAVKELAQIEQEYKNSIQGINEDDISTFFNMAKIYDEKRAVAIANHPENKLFGTRRQRGWGTVGYISYGKFLEDFQQRLFSANGGLPADFINLMSPPSFTLDDGSKALLSFEQAHIDHCKTFTFRCMQWVITGFNPMPIALKRLKP